jgi:endoglucanase
MNKHLMIFILILTCLTFNKITVADGFLKTKGKIIVNSNGEEVYLKGLGLGGWLVPEGYMLHTSGFANSPTEIRNRIEALIGNTNTDAYYKEYYKYYVNKADIDKIAQWGFNSVRLPFTYKLLTPPDQPGVYLEDGFALLDSCLSWCKQNKIYLILDMHCAPGAQNKLNISDSDGEARLWTDPQNRTRTVDIWKKIAERYANEEWIGGYDLINETAYDLGSSNQLLRELFINITNAIRTIDNNHILFIEGNWFATDFNGLTPPWDDNMAYSFHKYWNSTDLSTIQYLINIKNTYNVPLWLGETGENSNGWFVELVELLKQQNIGWAWWPHKKIDSVVGPLSATLTPAYQTLLNYWSGSGSKPSADFAYNALLNQAKQLSISNCKFHKDVIDALIRQPNNEETISFGENLIPGVIYGVNYDLGKPNYAYKDNVYKNISGSSGGSVYNSGGQYRNDGVDIESCSDVSTIGYNVGYIESGEWLKYTATCLQSGHYDIKLRVAGNTSEGRIKITIDGNTLSNLISVPATGGWQKWTTINAGELFLPAGDHSLTIQFFNTGFNFNYIEFVENTTLVDDNQNLPASFCLYQNYPNPFNPTTKIKYSTITSPSTPSPYQGEGHRVRWVTLKVYDILGNEVATLVNEEKMAGIYEIEFDGSSLPSGIYFCKLTTDNFTSINKMILMK